MSDDRNKWIATVLARRDRRIRTVTIAARIAYGAIVVGAVIWIVSRWVRR